MDRRVLVVDSDEQSQAAIAALVGDLGHTVEGVATGGEARLAVRREPPAAVVLDVDLADTSGYELCRELRDQFGEILPIVLMSATRTEPRDEVAGLLLGADAYVVKPFRSDLLLAHMRRLLARSPALPGPSALTNRERQVLELMVEGWRPREIAERLCITSKTTSTHIERIMAKLGAHSQAQAVAFAVRDGMGSARD